MTPYLRFEILSDTYLPSPYMYTELSPPPPPPHSEDFTCHVQANMDCDDECQVIHEFSDVKCCFVI